MKNHDIQNNLRECIDEIDSIIDEFNDINNEPNPFMVSFLVGRLHTKLHIMHAIVSLEDRENGHC